VGFLGVFWKSCGGFDQLLGDSSKVVALNCGMAGFSGHVFISKNN
jgi:hypothetical protein